MNSDQKLMAEYLNKLNNFVINLGNSQFLSQNLQGDLFSGFQETPDCNIN